MGRIGRLLAPAVLCAALAFGQNTKTAHPHLERLAAVLNLTEAQKTQVQTIFDSSRAQAEPVTAQLKENRQAIAALIKSNPQDLDAQLQTLATTRGTLTTQLTVIVGKGFAQAWSLLTPEQRQKAEQLHALFAPRDFGGINAH